MNPSIKTLGFAALIVGMHFATPAAEAFPVGAQLACAGNCQTLGDGEALVQEARHGGFRGGSFGAPRFAYRGGSGFRGGSLGSYRYGGPRYVSRGPGYRYATRGGPRYVARGAPRYVYRGGQRYARAYRPDYRYSRHAYRPYRPYRPYRRYHDRDYYSFYFGGWGWPYAGYYGLGYGYPYAGYGYYDYGDYGYDTAYLYGTDHVQWCLARYRSYDPASDTYLGYDGLRHRCVGP